jgi:bacillithiol biosynthesis deacetylase BshB1
MIDALCVGAHPDDVEIGMGATVAGMVARGMSVAILDLTDGEPTPLGSKETRAAESRAAADTLGVRERTTLDLPNRALFDTVEARRMVAEEIRRARPRVLFAPFARDAHPDHCAAAAICLAARFWAKFSKTEMSGEPHYVPRVYQYYAVHERSAQRPDFVVDVTTHVETKRACLEAYASQFVDNPANTHVIDMVVDQMRYWGSLVGTDYGEPFSAPEQLGVSSPADLL